MFMNWETQNVFKLNFRPNTIPIKGNKFACIYMLSLVIKRHHEENKKVIHRIETFTIHISNKGLISKIDK